MKTIKGLMADGGWKDALALLGIAAMLVEFYVILWFLQ